MRKSTLLLGAAAMALCTTFASCGGNSSQNSNDNKQATEATTVDELSLACKAFFEKDAQMAGNNVTVTFNGDKINCEYEFVNTTEEDLANFGGIDSIAQKSKDMMISCVVSFGEMEGFKDVKEAIMSGKTFVFKNKYNGIGECEYSVNKADIDAAMESAAQNKSEEE